MAFKSGTLCTIFLPLLRGTWAWKNRQITCSPWSGQEAARMKWCLKLIGFASEAQGCYHDYKATFAKAPTGSTDVKDSGWLSSSCTLCCSVKEVLNSSYSNRVIPGKHGFLYFQCRYKIVLQNGSKWWEIDPFLPIS